MPDGDQIRAVCSVNAGKRQGLKVGTGPSCTFFGFSPKAPVSHRVPCSLNVHDYQKVEEVHREKDSEHNCKPALEVCLFRIDKI